MPSVCFQIKSESSLEDAWEELSVLGFDLLYSSEDENGNKEIYAHIPEHTPLEGFVHVSKVVPADLTFIDWEHQWALHGADYRDGCVHVDLGTYGEIRLKPGPGFGDLSHPTTRLVIQMMSGHLQGKDVLDIGSGSGILSIAAIAMGARSVWGIEIDPHAISHAQENLTLNKMYDQVSFGFVSDYLESHPQENPTVLINMIESEQEEAWSSLPNIKGAEVFASGVLQEDRDRYLEFATARGWKLLEEKSLEGWLGFHFIL